MRVLFGVAGALIWGLTQVSYAQEVNDVVISQNSGSRIINISYNLTGEPAIITLAIETNNIPLAAHEVAALSGAVNKVVEPGTGLNIEWDAGTSWGNNFTTEARARITAWSTNAPPPVMVVDLAGGTDATTYPVYYYPSIDSLPDGGVTMAYYKTSYLVLRKMPAGTFHMQDSYNPVVTTLSRDFYMGVYQVTQGQWYNIMGTAPSGQKSAINRVFRPVENVTYSMIRGGTNGIAWPVERSIDEGSFLHVLRSKSNITTFDLPTDAQWEYACRAGLPTAFNNGNFDTSNPSTAAGTKSADFDVVGRYSGNASDPLAATPTGGTAIVGVYQPNNWGLYDMHGNVWEICLDWYTDSADLTGGVDPVGVDEPPDPTKPYRVCRGGAHSLAAGYGTAIYRHTHAMDSEHSHVGFRLCYNLP